MPDTIAPSRDAGTFAYHFSVDLRLLCSVQRELLLRSRWYRLMQYGYAIIPLPFILLSLAAGQDWRHAITNNLFWIVAAPIFGFVVVPWLNRWGLARQLRSNPVLSGPRTLSLTDAGLAVATQGGESLIHWPSFLKILETTQTFLFYYAPGCAHYLPRAAVPAEQLPLVRAFIRSHVAVPLDLRTDSHDVNSRGDR